MNRTYSAQKRITGRSPELYKWEEHRPSRKHTANTRPGYPASAHAKMHTSMFSNKDKIMITVVAMLLIVLLGGTIFMMADNAKIRIATADLKTANKTIEEVEISALQIRYNKDSSREACRQQGRDVLGMILPEDEDRQVLSIDYVFTNESAQTAEANANGR